MATTRSVLILNGRLGRHIEKRWLLFFWLLVVVKLSAVTWYFFEPIPPEYEAASYLAVRVLPILFGVGLFGSMLYCMGYDGGGVKVLWFFQVTTVMRVLADVVQILSLNLSLLEFVLCSVEVALILLFLVWNGRLIALNTEVEQRGIKLCNKSA